MLKIFSLNLEGHRHLQSRVLPFLQAEQPDLVCFQEVFRADLPRLRDLGYQGQFQAMAIMNRHSFFQQATEGEFGLFLGSTQPITGGDFELYRGNSASALPVAPKLLNGTASDGNFFRRYLGWLTVKQDSTAYMVATTHFTYDPHGQVNQSQRHDLEKLLAITRELPPHILTGDFNTPRGKELWSRLTESYQDKIPPEIETTIDNQLHRAEHDINLVVDGFFTQPPYQVQSIRVVAGLSDHQGILAEVSR